MTQLRGAPQAATQRCPIRFCMNNARPDKGVCEDHIWLLGQPQINALLIKAARRGKAPLYVRDSEGGALTASELDRPDDPSTATASQRPSSELVEVALSVCGYVAMCGEWFEQGGLPKPLSWDALERWTGRLYSLVAGPDE